MITEDYCSYEVSMLLKEKGFEIDTNKDYWKIGGDGIMYFMSSIGVYTSNPHDEYAFYRPENSYPCPTHQMAMKWLREDKHIFIELSTSIDLNGKYHFNYIILNKECEYVRRGHMSFNWNYEDAVEAALKYCLENLI